MITRVTSIGELKQMFIEILMNKTSKVTKVSDQSIVNGVSYGVAKVAQKALKDVALVESHIFPDGAYGQHLDDIAEKSGIAPRFGASQSSTYVRLVGDSGTAYVAATHFFNSNGVVFELTDDITIGSEGYVYAKVRSQDSGANTNVKSLTINKVNPVPSGHKFVVNEYEATGGRDAEDDVSLRLRIKEGPNVAANGTLAYITQVFINFNTNVLRVYSYGTNTLNQPILAISTQNGVDLTVNELSSLLDNVKDYLPINFYNSVTNNSIGVELRNVEYEEVDVDFRCQLVQTTSIDEVRRDIQVEMSKYFDYRNWTPDKKVEWDDLLQIVKSNKNVKYVADSFFNPGRDITVELGKLPRIRSFIIRDLDGNIMVDNSGVLDPIYYPSTVDNSLQATLL